MTKIRIISDLHYDKGLNKEEYFDQVIGTEFLKEKADVTLIAGDLAAELQNKKEFLEAYFKNQYVFFTGGNHDVYVEGLKTIYEINDELKKEFPLMHSFWKYLNNDWAWIPGTNDSVAVIGSTFYTDYEYSNWTVESFNEYQKAWNFWIQAYGLKAEYEEVTELSADRIIKENQFIAKNSLNDFRWGYEAPGQHLTPYTYRELHLKSKDEVLRCYDEILKQNPNALVILLTHHCLSSKCIDSAYLSSKGNASYVSELEDWLCENMPNLRLVVSGHVHCRKDFKFGKDNKRYVVNACGYLPYNEPFKKKPEFNANFIIRTEDL